MSKPFDGPPRGDGPVQAARGHARSILKRRFYGDVGVAAVPEGYGLRLDGKPVRTPSHRLLAVPTSVLADAIAAEWGAQRETIDPSTMPLTRLANTIIDGVADRPEPTAAEIAKYAATDLLFYRAETPAALVDRQRRHWDPVLAWARQTLGAEFKLGQGIVHVAQPQDALDAVRAAIPDDPWRIGAVHVLTTLTGSALIALAVLRGFLSAEDAWRAANVDEDWNMEQWGRDEIALDRSTSRFAELNAAATVLRSLG